MCLEDDEGIGSTESNDSFERELHFSFVYSALCLPSGAFFCNCPALHDVRK